MNLGSWVLSLAILALCAVCRPHRSTCPLGTDLRTGIRLDGSFECWPHPSGDPDWDGTHGRPERGKQSSFIVQGRIYCGPRQQAVVVDFRTVRCM